MSPSRKLIVVGDRVLVKLDRPEERSEVGLYLPETVVAKEKVQSGLIVATGPGIPLPDPEHEVDEPWRETTHEPRHLPMQAEVGDYALFLKKQSIRENGYPPKAGQAVESGFLRNDSFTGKFVNHGVMMLYEFVPP